MKAQRLVLALAALNLALLAAFAVSAQGDRAADMRTPRAFAAAALCGLAGAAAADEIELVREGKAFALSAAARAYVTEQMPKLFATCSLNSRDHPQVFASSPPSTTWRETRARDHLEARFATRELLLGLHDARFPGPSLSRSGEDVVVYSKCSGGDMIRFVCAAGLKAAMPSSYYRMCDLLEEADRKKPGK